jgi:hypothetical protein
MLVAENLRICFQFHFIYVNYEIDWQNERAKEWKWKASIEFIVDVEEVEEKWNFSPTFNFCHEMMNISPAITTEIICQ